MIGVADEATDHEPPMRPTTKSGWMINWTGLAAIALVALVAVAGWRWLDGAGDDEAVDAVSSPVTSDVTTVPSTVSRPSTTIVRQAPATTAAPTTTTEPTERRVLISGEMRPCRFGDNCLVASFRIEGFEQHPGRFVCIYPNSRRDFGFRNDGVDEACLTADQGDTITIEVDGVQSATISEQNLDGTADG